MVKFKRFFLNLKFASLYIRENVILDDVKIIQ